MPNVAVVGMGNWGANLVRTFNQLESLCMGCDQDQKKLAKMSKLYQNVEFTDSYDKVINNRNVDGIVIAAPSPLHFELAKKALSAGKAAYVEKPLTLNSKDAAELISLAQKKKVPLMVGHLMKYHPALHKIKDLIDKKELGDIFYLYAQRVNLGTIRSDENALWNFAPHDISVCLYLLGDKIDTVSARGGCYLQKGIEDVVFLNLKYKDGMMAQVQISWLDPHKERRLTIVGSKKMVAFDDMQASEKIKIYDKGVNREPRYESYGDALSLRFGDISIPKIDMSEPLKLECQHFLECIRENKRPFTDGEEGLRVVQILEKAQESLKNEGKPVAL